MKYRYLTGDLEKPLALFSSKMLLSASFTSVVGVSVLLLTIWPHQPLSGFILADHSPLPFFIVFTATLIIYCYVNLCIGCGDMIQRGDPSIRHRLGPAPFEKDTAFFHYGLLEFLSHTAILLFPFLPLLILAASISAVDAGTFLNALCVLYTASLLCIMFGFTIYLYWGRFNTIGYITGRTFVVVFLFGTFIFAPAANPIHYLYLLNESPTAAGLPYVVYMTMVTVTILVLAAVNHILVRRHVIKEQTR